MAHEGEKNTHMPALCSFGQLLYVYLPNLIQLICEKGNFFFFSVHAQRCRSPEVSESARGHIIIKHQRWHLKDLSKWKEFYCTIDCQTSLPERTHVLRNIFYRTLVFKVDKGYFT